MQKCETLTEISPPGSIWNLDKNWRICDLCNSLQNTYDIFYMLITSWDQGVPHNHEQLYILLWAFLHVISGSEF